MQKFIVSKIEYDRAYGEHGPISEMPQFIVMEGELLEGGGTVEKLGHKCADGVACNCPTEKCKACEMAKEGYSGVPPHTCHKVEKNESHDKPCCYHQPCGCSCHHKKEEKPLHGHALGVSCVPDCFNRETPKRCPICGHTKEMGKVSRCEYDFHKEEVKLPEKIKPSRDVDWELGNKINEILAYLASKEKK